MLLQNSTRPFMDKSNPGWLMRSFQVMIIGTERTLKAHFGIVQHVSMLCKSSKEQNDWTEWLITGAAEGPQSADHPLISPIKTASSSCTLTPLQKFTAWPALRVKNGERRGFLMRHGSMKCQNWTKHWENALECNQKFRLYNFKGKLWTWNDNKKKDNFCLIGNTITTLWHLKKRQIDKLSSISTAKQVYFKNRKMVQKKQFICMKDVRNF